MGDGGTNHTSHHPASSVCVWIKENTEIYFYLLLTLLLFVLLNVVAAVGYSCEPNLITIASRPNLLITSYISYESNHPIIHPIQDIVILGHWGWNFSKPMSRLPKIWNICVFSVKINISTTGGFRVGFFQPDTNHP